MFQLSFNWLFFRYKASPRERVDGWSFHRPIINNHRPRLACFVLLLKNRKRRRCCGGEVGKGYLAFFFPLKLESEHLPPAFSLQPSKKNRKSEAKRQPNDSSEFFLFENFAKAEKGHKIIIGAKIFGVSLGLPVSWTWSLHPPGPPLPPSHLLFASSCFLICTVIWLASWVRFPRKQTLRGRLTGVAFRKSTCKGSRRG